MFQNQFFLEHFDATFLVVATEWLSSFKSCGFMERGENTLAVTGLRRWSSSRMPGGLVYSQAAFFFGTCAGRRSNFFSSPSDCRCALSDFVRFFAMSIVCSAFVLNASAARQRRFHPGDGSKVDKQVAAPTETRTLENPTTGQCIMKERPTSKD